MIKVTRLLTRANGVTRADFARRHHEVSGPLIAAIPEARRHLVRYSQSHAADGTPFASDRADGSDDLWFDDLDGAEAVLSSDAFTRDLVAAEAEFLDPDATRTLVGASTDLVGDAATEAIGDPFPGPAADSFGPLPRGVNHLGITVPDLDAATEFFRSAFGARVAYDGLTPEDPPREGAETEHQLGLPRGSRIRRQRMIQIGLGPGFEVFEIDAPERQRAAGLADFGLNHVSLYVDDIDRALERAVAAGARKLSEVHGNSAHEDTEGNGSVYTAAPWGTLIELQTLPHGHWYDADSEARAWTPPRR